MERCLRNLVVGMVVLVTVLVPALACAKKNPVKEQLLKLNEEAVEALAAGDYVLAIERLEESLAIEELNVTYLNLGRAYAKNGQCNKALEAYDRMAVAPRVDEPSPELIFATLTKYRAELLETCPGKVRIRCNPSTLQVSVDGAAPMACPERLQEVAPGPHRFDAFDAGKLVSSQENEIEGMSISYVDLIKPQVIEYKSAEPDNAGSISGLTWAALGTGAGLLLMAAVIDQAFIAPDVEHANTALFTPADAQKFSDALDTKQTVNAVVLIGGGVVLATGLGSLAYDLFFSGPAQPDEVSAWANAEGLGLTFQMRF